MAMIDNAVAAERRRAGVRRTKKNLPRIDMTPMVDLGFLLITFFIFSSEISKPVAMTLAMPAPLKDKEPPMTAGETGSLTVLPGADDHIWYYQGSFKKASSQNAVLKTDYSPEGIRKIIQHKQQMLDRIHYQNKGRDAMVLLIKPGPNSSYKNVVDILDEATITGVKIYAVTEPDKEEKILLKE